MVIRQNVGVNDSLGVPHLREDDCAGTGTALRPDQHRRVKHLFVFYSVLGERRTDKKS